MLKNMVETGRVQTAL